MRTYQKGMDVEQWKAKGTYLTIRGRRLFVVDSGGRGPALLLLHGYPTSSHDFHRVLPRLGERYRVIAHDHLGFGLSDKPRDYSYSLFEQADMALALWQELGVGSAHLVAHDYGTSVATEILARYELGYRPVGLSSLTLSNGSVHIELAHLRVIQKLLLNETLGPLVARASSQRVFVYNMKKLWADPAKLSREELDAMWKLLVRDDGRLRLPQITQYLRERRHFWHRWIGALQACPVPANILWATGDPVAGRDMAELHHEEIPDSRLALLEGVGHYPMLEAPERWTDALCDLLALGEDRAAPQADWAEPPVV